MELKELVKDNPWKELGRQILSDLNQGVWSPDAAVPESWAVLKADAGLLAERNSASLGKPDYIYHLGMQPQPFVGTLRAPIWWLMYNPGYNPIDEYNKASIANGKKMGVVSRFTDNQEAEFNAMRERQRLMACQLCFEGEAGREFYLLDESFNTTDKQEGGYYWYFCKCFGRGSDKYLLTNHNNSQLKVLSDSVFNLEFFPYHSRKYRIGERIGSEIAHYAFWLQCVNFAVQNNKILIVRGLTPCYWDARGTMANELSKIDGFWDAVTSGRVFTYKNANVSLTWSNLFQLTTTKTLEKIKDRTVIESALTKV